MTNLINWANSKLLDLTFIEVMPMSDTDMPRHMQFVSLDKIYKELNGIYKFNQMPDFYTIVGLVLIIAGVLIVNLLGKVN